jgi:PAS domain-containing protein
LRGDGTGEGVPLERLSDCIEAIYDSAIDPDLWPVALEKVCRLVNGLNGVIMLADMLPAGGQLRFQRAWNVREDDMGVFAAEYARDNPLTPLFGRFAVDEPYNVTAVMPAEQWEATRIFREFARPRGFGDSLGVTLLKSPLQFASLSIAVSGAFDYCGPAELRALRLIAPHARRALAIGDLIEMRGLKAAALETALDRLTPGVALVDARGGLVFANLAARRGGGLAHPLTLAAGRVGLADRAADAALQQALERARAGDAQPLTLAVHGGDGEVAFVYLLRRAATATARVWPLRWPTRCSPRRRRRRWRSPATPGPGLSG